MRTKVINWIIALCGLWEFGDIAAPFVSNHILAGLVLVIAGGWAALARSPRTARRLDWMAAAVGAWLVIAPFIFDPPAIPAGLWNDIVVGGIVFILGVWAALAAPRVAD